MAQADLQVLAEDAGFRFARLRSLGILLWLQTPTPDRARLIAERLRELTPGGFALLTVVTPACAPVGSDVRSVFEAALRTHRDSLLGIATVIQVEGVLGGLTRAIARAIAIVGRVSYPNNVYATVADAAKWLPQILANAEQPPPSTEEIVTQVTGLLGRR